MNGGFVLASITWKGDLSRGPSKKPRRTSEGAGKGRILRKQKHPIFLRHLAHSKPRSKPIGDTAALPDARLPGRRIQ